MKIENHRLGTLIETNSLIALFGNRNSQITNLQTEFSTLHFKRVKQVHGDRIAHTSPHSIDFSSEADAHYTGEKNLGLCIATADCIPIVIYNSKPIWIACIHAGWRGVEKRVVPKTIATLVRNGAQATDLQVFVGPHIQKPSFEVGNDVRDSLLNSFKGSKDSVWHATSNGKSKVDLSLILKFQLTESGVNLDHTFFEMKDTVTDSNYHSFRRDRESSGRQLSFVALK